MINNNTDDFGCFQNSLFIVSCPHYFENILKLRTNLFSAARCFKELTISYYFSLFKLLHVLCDNIPGQNCTESWENVPFKNYLCILLLTPSNTGPQLTKVSTWQCPHKCTLLRCLLCVFPCEPIALLRHQADVSAVTFWVALSNGIS